MAATVRYTIKQFEEMPEFAECRYILPQVLGPKEMATKAEVSERLGKLLGKVVNLDAWRR